MDNLEEMKNEFFKNGGTVKYIGKKPKRDLYKTNDLITIHTYDSTIKVL